MLIIRHVQMKVFEEAALRNYEDRMALHLRSNFSEQTKNATEQELREMIKTGISKAESYQVTDEMDVEGFLEFVVRYGPDFETDPQVFWAVQILQDESLTGTEKMNQMDDYELFVLAVNRV
jgi:hypothetical protein